MRESLKWSAHRRIAKYLAKCTPLLEDRRLLRELLRGVVDPDVHLDYVVVVRKRRVYEVPARHHGSEAKELAIKEVWKSRKAYLKKPSST